MKIEIEKKTEEKVILISIIGTLVALKNEKISLEEAESFIFSPYFSGKLKKSKIREEIVDLVDECCELEDIMSLLPDYLEMTYDKLQKKALEMLKEYACLLYTSGKDGSATFSRGFGVQQLEERVFEAGLPEEKETVWVSREYQAVRDMLGLRLNVTDYTPGDSLVRYEYSIDGGLSWYTAVSYTHL